MQIDHIIKDLKRICLTNFKEGYCSAVQNTYNCVNIDDFSEKQYEEDGFVITLLYDKSGKKCVIVSKR